MPGDKLNLEEMKQRDFLTEEEMRLIQEGGLKVEEKKDDEVVIEGEGKKDDEIVISDDEMTDEDLLNADESTLKEDQKTRRQGLLDKQKEEEQKLVDTPDDKLDKDQLAQKQKIVKAREDEAAQQFENATKEYATQKKITVEEAKEELSKIKEIRDRYGNDPDKLAESNLYLQRMVSAKEQEIKKYKEVSQQREITPESLDKLVQNRQFIVNGRAYTKEDLIALARKSDTTKEITDGMDDEAVYRMVLRDISQGQNAKLKQSKESLSVTAEKKRAQAISELANCDSKFFARAKELVEKVSDSYIASDIFSVDKIVEMVKGERYDQDIEEVRKQAYKEGQEQAKILETKPPVGGARPAGKKVIRLSPEQKKRALEMFDIQGISDQEKFKMYVKVYPEEFEDKKKEK